MQTFVCYQYEILYTDAPYFITQHPKGLFHTYASRCGYLNRIIQNEWQPRRFSHSSAFSLLVAAGALIP